MPADHDIATPERVGTYTVSNRLRHEATRHLAENAGRRIQAEEDNRHRRLMDVFEQIALEAYTRGVRDGYVQAVSSEQGE
jgi:hypothetical protein